jgi:hypothetical protein
VIRGELASDLRSDPCRLSSAEERGEGGGERGANRTSHKFRLRTSKVWRTDRAMKAMYDTAPPHTAPYEILTTPHATHGQKTLQNTCWYDSASAVLIGFGNFIKNSHIATFNNYSSL